MPSFPLYKFYRYEKNGMQYNERNKMTLDVERENMPTSETENRTGIHLTLFLMCKEKRVDSDDDSFYLKNSKGAYM